MRLRIKCNHAAEPWRLIPSVRDLGVQSQAHQNGLPKGSRTPLCLSIRSIFVFLLRGRGWGLMDYALMETLSMKWPSEVTLPGQVLRSHEHTAGAGAGWGSGAIGRACGKRLAGMLLYVLFSLPPICSWTRVLGCHWELHLLCFRGSHSTTACKYRTNCLLVWLMNWMEKLWWFALVSNSGDVVLTISSSWCNMTLIQHKSGSLCFLFCLRF